MTLDLAEDYYQIASEASYNYSKDEAGDKNKAHNGVREWHYFINDILFQEYGEEETLPYTVTVNIKERPDGTFVYSFNAEKQKEEGAPQTLHAAVNQTANSGEANASSGLSVPNLADGVKQNLSQLKSTAPMRQTMRELRMPRLTTVEQDAAEAAMAAQGNENPPVQGAATLPTMRQFQHPLGVSATQEDALILPRIEGISSAAEKKLADGKHLQLERLLKKSVDYKRIMC